MKRRRRLLFEPLEARRLLADLQLQSVLLVENDDFSTPTTPVIGERMCVRVNWRATAMPPTATFRIEYVVDGVSVFVTPTGTNINSDSNHNWARCAWYSSPGTHTVERVTIDVDDAVGESSESNNTLQPNITFTPSEPTTLPAKFVSPMGGVALRNWSITNYNDVDPTPDFQDYQGGPFSYDGHDAYDLSISNFARMDAGIPVYAAAAGTVESAQDGHFDRNTLSESVPANFVVINHGSGWKTQYYHFAANTIVVRAGDVVRPGQLLGLTGSSGNSSGPHLHFAIRHNGAPIEPEYAPDTYFVAPYGYQGDLPTAVKDIAITNFSSTTAELKERSATQPVFSTQTPQTPRLLFWLANLKVGESLQLKQYRPDGSLHASSNFTWPSQVRSGFFSWNLGGGPISSSPGMWRMAIEKNGVELATKPFEVTSGPGVAGIKVTQDTTIIIDNRTTALDFGTIALNDTQVSKAFTISNHGTAALTLSDLVLPPGFAMSGSFPTSVAAGNSASLTLELRTARAGAKFGAVQFASNDPDAPVFNFHVSGTVTGAAPAGSPVLSMAGPAVAYATGAAATPIRPLATVTDANSSDFGGGMLSVEFVSNSSSQDVLEIRNMGVEAGQIGVSGSSVSFAGVEIGTLSGGTDGQPLLVELNSSATPSAVQELVRNITFGTRAVHPETLARYVRFTLVDESGNTSNQPVAVVIQNLLPTTVYIDANGDVVLADSSVSGKDDDFRLERPGSDIVLTDLTGNMIDASSIEGSTGSGTAAVTIPFAVFATANQLALDARDGYDKLSFDVSQGNPLPTDGYGIISGNPTIIVIQPNLAPTMEFELPPQSPDSVTILEDADTQTVELTGIAAGLNESQSMTILATSSDLNLIADLQVDNSGSGSSAILTFKPVSNRSGVGTISVTVKDDGGTLGGGVDTTTRVLTVVVTGVNDVPAFTSGGNVSASDEDGEQSFAAWAAPMQAGADDETKQGFSFLVMTEQESLFEELPAVDADGMLTFKPAANARGTAVVTVRVRDDGGTVHGGVDQSDEQTFEIEITKPHPKHNAAKAEDVNNDGARVAEDALSIVNFINTFGAEAILETDAIGPLFYDVTGDNNIAADDALTVINYINRFGAGEGEGNAKGTGDRGQETGDGDDLLGLLAMDVAAVVKRKK